MRLAADSKAPTEEGARDVAGLCGPSSGDGVRRARRALKESSDMPISFASSFIFAVFGVLEGLDPRRRLQTESPLGVGPQPVEGSVV
eukprot:CAMPEP_0202840680 /NCGR_PEP_ID=MMETSP1389-20130828/56401_1 /ASSEMBLY_ACC=CAM_ASM_000865 /TAXON_ID=302021 /ORGANISM="Rhodomonas sp., Strain CCMP768" /LENGTH=86 /DNA_ID=CAMNT_0049517357 /DNA_START=9 /DNA_END=266 /DNA_ORIENTATION=-